MKLNIEEFRKFANARYNQKAYGCSSIKLSIGDVSTELILTEDILNRLSEPLKPEEFLDKIENMINNSRRKEFVELYNKNVTFMFNGLVTEIPFDATVYNAIVEVIIENYGPFIKYRAGYVPTEDMTVIFKDTYKSPNGECISTEVVGFYHGEPDDKATEEYKDKSKAVYKE